MEKILELLPLIQIILVVLLTTFVLLQQGGSSAGSAFGGSDSSVHHERRGSEKTLFKVTLILAILFVLSTFTELLIAQQIDSDAVINNDLDIQVKTIDGIDVNDTENLEVESSPVIIN